MIGSVIICAQFSRTPFPKHFRCSLVEAPILLFLATSISQPFYLYTKKRTSFQSTVVFANAITLFVHCAMLSPLSWPGSVSAAVFWTLAVSIWISFVPCAAHDQTTPSKPTTGRRMEWRLHRRASPPARTVEEWGEWCVAHTERMKMKYGDGERTKEKRGQGTNLYGSSSLSGGSFGC